MQSNCATLGCCCCRLKIAYSLVSYLMLYGVGRRGIDFVLRARGFLFFLLVRKNIYHICCSLELLVSIDTFPASKSSSSCVSHHWVKPERGGGKTMKIRTILGTLGRCSGIIMTNAGKEARLCFRSVSIVVLQRLVLTL